MSGQLVPGPPATMDDLWVAQERHRLLSTELPRVRAAATSWRNALGGLLVALAGFSLIKGRNDVSGLTETWAAIVGLVLLGAIISGAVGALSLIRASHGQPKVIAVRELQRSDVSDHFEAIASSHALRRGIWLTMMCAGLLVAAVAATWYGPDRASPSVQVGTSAGLSVCGGVVRAGQGVMVLNTRTGEVTVNINDATSIRAVTACP